MKMSKDTYAKMRREAIFETLCIRRGYGTNGFFQDCKAVQKAMINLRKGYYA
jgi:hypothetical protein